MSNPFGQLDDYDRMQEEFFTKERERLHKEAFARTKELDRIMKKVHSVLTEDEFGFLWNVIRGNNR